MNTSRARLLSLVAGFLISFSLNAQKALTPEDLAAWKRITDRAVSNDGRWAGARIAPWDGDAVVHLYNSKGREVAKYAPADRFNFSSSSEYAIVRLVPARALTDSLKIAKTKKDGMPMNSLVIRRLAGGEETIDSVKTYKIAEKADWLAYQQTEKDKTLSVRSLDGKTVYSFPNVSEFGFAKESPLLYYLVAKTDTVTGISAGLYTMNPGEESSRIVKESEGVFRNITWSRRGEYLAFLFCEKKDSTYKAMSLWASDGTGAMEVAARGNELLPEGWIVSEHGKLNFSDDGSRLFFGTSPEPRQRDTTVLAERRPNVHLWSWDEPVQYTAQNNTLGEELKKNYNAVYNIASGNIVQLSTPQFPEMRHNTDSNAPVALVATSEQYSLSSMWEGRTRRDIYAVLLDTGERKQLTEASYDYLQLSPSGKYAYTYSVTDSLWYSIDIASGVRRNLTDPAAFTAWDEEFDMPDYPASYGSAGWTSDDRYLLVYDRYDIWQLDPAGKLEPVNLTVNGREKGIQYRYIRLDREERFIDTDKTSLLSGFDTATKGSGYYETSLASSAAPKTLIAGRFMLRQPLKAKDSDAILYTKETYEQFPELLLSDMRFKKSLKLTNLGDQQKGIRWGTAELVSWVSLDGKRINGTLHKPAGFDPKKKYPLIVNFYERGSDELHDYRMPQPHRSTVDYHMYNSNGYVVFNPDVVYEDGYPGESCFNCVMPGISMLIEQGFIDEKAIGAQGHSWGGYQVAYLATRTDLFAAIESGAPVVNMFSAYGGIRWGTGLARAFQYEHTQSRIGGHPWSAHSKFIENSPLFTMDKLTTPILIMHNDQDGHVPWYQAIEWFVALKRLGKPAWMLNYTGEIHWPANIANRVDFQKRMLQFFDHYLKGAPLPRWMSEGVRAVDRDFELGYELD